MIDGDGAGVAGQCLDESVAAIALLGVETGGWGEEEQKSLGDENLAELGGAIVDEGAAWGGAKAA